MPTAPYTLLKASINGGAASTGGLTATSGQSVQLSADATATLGARSYRFRIYEFPEGFTQPSGWSTDADGTYFYAAGATPPVFAAPTLPLWGKVLVDLTLNGGDAGIGPNSNEDMVDRATAIQTLSPNGLEDIAFDEDGQFASGEDIDRQWAGALKRTLRTIDDLL